METTLSFMCQHLGMSSFDLLKLKQCLLNYKKEGKLFFNVDILSLGMDEPFEIYHHLVPNNSTYVNAFPIPLSMFQFYQSEHSQYEYLKEFFESYYMGIEFQETDFDCYISRKPYIGTDYVWYEKS